MLIHHSNDMASTTNMRKKEKIYQVSHWRETNHKVNITCWKGHTSCIWTKYVCPGSRPQNLQKSGNSLDSPINVRPPGHIFCSNLEYIVIITWLGFWWRYQDIWGFYRFNSNSIWKDFKQRTGMLIRNNDENIRIKILKQPM